MSVAISLYIVIFNFHRNIHVILFGLELIGKCRINRFVFAHFAQKDRPRERFHTSRLC